MLHDSTELRRRYQRGMLIGWFLAAAWLVLAYLVWFVWAADSGYAIAADILLALLAPVPIHELFQTYRDYRRSRPAQIPTVRFCDDLGYLGNETALYLILRELPPSADALFLLHEPTRTVKLKKPTTELYHRCTDSEWQDLLLRLDLHSPAATRSS